MAGVSRTNTSCLQDPSSAVETISLQMCGNGIVEAGEQCDPGEDVDSPCCDSKTCKFKNGAVCDPDSSPCCTAQCGFAPSTQVCRPAKDANCDVPEMCTGNASSCPGDVVKPNGACRFSYPGLCSFIWGQARAVVGITSPAQVDSVHPSLVRFAFPLFLHTNTQSIGFLVQCQQLGASMNLTKECPNQSSNTCQVSCQDPTQSNQCILLTALLVDGSPCG